MQQPSELKILKKIIPQLFQITHQDFQSAHLKQELKDDESVVTETDLKLNHLIQQTIKDNFPDDNILSEEDDNTRTKLSGRLWVLDPICGTYNFSVGIPFYTTNVCLFNNQKPIFALVIDYPKKTYYWASENNPGIFKKENSIKPKLELSQKQVINVDTGKLQTPNTPKKIRLAFANIFHDLIASGHECPNFFTSLSSTYTALAKYEGLIFTSTNAWDFAAACYLMEKNGGIATDFHGNPWSINSTDVVASLDKKAHKKLLKIISTPWPK